MGIRSIRGLARQPGRFARHPQRVVIKPKVPDWPGLTAARPRNRKLRTACSSLWPASPAPARFAWRHAGSVPGRNLQSDLLLELRTLRSRKDLRLFGSAQLFVGSIYPVALCTCSGALRPETHRGKPPTPPAGLGRVLPGFVSSALRSDEIFPQEGPPPVSAGGVRTALYPMARHHHPCASPGIIGCCQKSW